MTALGSSQDTTADSGDAPVDTLLDDRDIRSTAARNLVAAGELERKAMELQRRVQVSRQLIDQAGRTMVATRRRRRRLAELGL